MTKELLKKRLKAMQKLIYKTFVAYDFVSNCEYAAEVRNNKFIYKNNNSDDCLTDSQNLFDLLRQANLLIQKINKQEITIITN